MFVAVCCDRGAPGSTTSALALGVASPEPSVVIEADPYGGDLALRCRTKDGAALPETPTVLTVATAARTATSPEVVSEYAHPFTDHTGLVPGHLTAEQSAGVTDWTPLARLLERSSAPMVVDLGRIHSHSPSLPLAAAADVLVAVTRPDLGAVVHLRERLARLVPPVAELRGRPPVLLPVVIAPRRVGPTHAAQIGEVLGDTAAGPVLAGVGWLAWDPRGVQQLERGAVTGRRARTALLRSAATVMGQVGRAAEARPSWRIGPRAAEAR